MVNPLGGERVGVFCESDLGHRTAHALWGRVGFGHARLPVLKTKPQDFRCFFTCFFARIRLSETSALNVLQKVLSEDLFQSARLAERNPKPCIEIPKKNTENPCESFLWPRLLPYAFQWPPQLQIMCLTFVHERRRNQLRHMFSALLCFSALICAGAAGFVAGASWAMPVTV